MIKQFLYFYFLGINNVIYNKECRELLNNENQSQRPSYCTEAQGPIPEVLQKEIEGKMGEHLVSFICQLFLYLQQLNNPKILVKFASKLHLNVVD